MILMYNVSPLIRPNGLWTEHLIDFHDYKRPVPVAAFRFEFASVTPSDQISSPDHDESHGILQNY